MSDLPRRRKFTLGSKSGGFSITFARLQLSSPRAHGNSPYGADHIPVRLSNSATFGVNGGLSETLLLFIRLESGITRATAELKWSSAS